MKKCKMTVMMVLLAFTATMICACREADMVSYNISPCYVAKRGDCFAHGRTAQEAVQDLEAKIYEDMDTEERIAAFMEHFPDMDKKYPAKEFYAWHHNLTGSCDLGRTAFVKRHGFDLEHDTFTVREFIALTREDYGGEIIRQLEETLKGRV